MADRPRLGELLIQAGLIDEARLEEALARQQEGSRPLGMTLVDMGAIDEETLVRTLARQLRVPVVWLRDRTVRADVLCLVPRELAEKHRCLPVMIDRRGGETLLLAMADPGDAELAEQVAERVGMPVRPVLAAPSELEEALQRHFPPASDDVLELDQPHFVGEDPGDGPPELLSMPAGPGELASPPPGPTRPSPARASGADPAILAALTQLLVEKGVLTREELVERVAALESGSDPT